LDPTSLILSALSSGAGQGIAEGVSDAIKNAYGRLKHLVSSRLGANSAAAVALAEHAMDPGTWQAPLAKALMDSGASSDPAVIRTAQQLMALLDEEGLRAGKYNVDVDCAQGVQVGDGNKQVNVFTIPPR
jgi:hypothetical protein